MPLHGSSRVSQELLFTSGCGRLATLLTVGPLLPVGCVRADSGASACVTPSLGGQTTELSVKPAQCKVSHDSIILGEWQVVRP